VARIELGVDLGMAEVLQKYDDDYHGANELFCVHIDALDYDINVRSSQIHPDSDVFKVGDVGRLVVTRRFAEVKRLL
jgi:hypothetical protein